MMQDEEAWKKSANGRYKCNIDASFSTSLNRVRLGMCLRDDSGDFVLAKTHRFASLCDIDVVRLSCYVQLWNGC
jgi:hypothetical protein